jgi:antitoxin (DNA-binding transcriptional repressor) of toxin-antitoxin stability system
MSNWVSKSQFKARALEFFRQVETTGEPLIVTDHGQPKLEIRRYASSVRNPLDVLRASVLRYERPTDPVGDDDWDAE